MRGTKLAAFFAATDKAGRRFLAARLADGGVLALLPNESASADVPSAPRGWLVVLDATAAADVRMAGASGVAWRQDEQGGDD